MKFRYLGVFGFEKANVFPKNSVRYFEMFLNASHDYDRLTFRVPI
jgi:hypothetical protein